VEFDAHTLIIRNRWTIDPCEGPSGLAIDRAHQILFSVCAHGKMAVVNTASGRVIAIPEIGQGPDAAAFDPALGIAFSSNGRDGTLTLVKEETLTDFTVAADIPTELGARTMALDPKTHQVFLATARFGPSTRTGGRIHRSIVPNSFVILVVGIVK
jgi:DNA-binding beta-propeller fold protein YncE